MTHEEIAELDSQYAERLRHVTTGDRETDHIEADGILMLLLTRLGFEKTTHEFGKIPKWYS